MYREMPSEHAVASMGEISTKQIQLARDIKSWGTGTSGKHTTLRFNNTHDDKVVSIPNITADAELLTDQSTINGAKIDIAALANLSTLNNLDTIIVRDASEVGVKNKEVLISDLSAFIDHAHTGSDAQIEISNGTAYVNRSITGDITLNNLGVTNLVRPSASLNSTTTADDDNVLIFDKSESNATRRVEVSDFAGKVLSKATGNCTFTSSGAATLNSTGMSNVHPADMLDSDHLIMVDRSVNDNFRTSTIAGVAPKILDKMSGHATSSSGALTLSAAGKGAALALMSGDATASAAGAVTLAAPYKPTFGTAAASKVLSTDASNNVAGINDCNATTVRVGAGANPAWRVRVNNDNLEFQFWNSSATPAAYQTRFVIDGTP